MKLAKSVVFSGHSAAVFALGKGTVPGTFLSASGDGLVIQWNLADNSKAKALAKVDCNVFSLLNLQKENLLVAGDMNGGVHWIEADGQTHDIAAHKKGVYAIEQFGENVFSVGGDGSLTKWNIGMRRPAETVYVSNKSLRSLAYHPELNELYIGSSDEAIHVLNADTLEAKYLLPKAHLHSVFSLLCLPEENLLISGGRDAQLCFWDLGAKPRLKNRLAAHLQTINHIVLGDGWLATASRDKSIRFWDLETQKLLKELNTIRDSAHFGSVNRLLWLEDEKILVSTGDDRHIMSWKVTL